jgi:hypothetical protein
MARQDEGRPRDGRWIGVIILIIIGVVLLAGQWLPDVGRYAPLAIGLALLAIFVVTRNAGALIAVRSSPASARHRPRPALPGAATAGTHGARLGFLGIWAPAACRRRVWPLIPGAILTFVGVARWAAPPPPMRSATRGGGAHPARPRGHRRRTAATAVLPWALRNRRARSEARRADASGPLLNPT